MPLAVCPNCGTTFVASAARRRYCKQACYLEYLRRTGSEGLVARFWAKVQKTDGCWLWAAGQIRGYGQFHLPRTGSDQQTVYAHRYAWTITNGSIPDNLSVLHKCDRPLCVRPDHLFLGTQQDNLEDARRKGRMVDGRHLIKVNDAGIADILTNYQPRKNGKQLAARYGITLTSLLRIVSGKQRVWQRTPEPNVESVRVVHVPVRGVLHVGDGVR